MHSAHSAAAPQPAAAQPAVFFEAVGALAHPRVQIVGEAPRGLSDLAIDPSAAEAVARLRGAGYFTVALLDIAAPADTGAAPERWRAAALTARILSATEVEAIECWERASVDPHRIAEAIAAYGLDAKRSVWIGVSEAACAAAEQAGLATHRITRAASGADVAAIRNLGAAVDEVMERAADLEALLLDHAADQELERGRQPLLEERAPA